jgi:hypothetical protein
MAHQYVSAADKLVRQILKAATKGPLGQPLTRSTIGTWFEKASADEITAAIAHGVREGWLEVEEGVLLPTTAGDAFGRHSRAGVKKKRGRL